MGSENRFCQFSGLCLNMLEKLYKHHNELIKMASVFSKREAEDIVQECYIKLHQYSSEDKCFTYNNLNKSYLFIVIR